ncbi:alpha/beta fold hydrolase [Iamia sp.]|uniref:alpha/beta fold hydrolase n=1 Tax=Iamia sp. TaxID=2722710 RepID=UPI0032C22289
MALVADLLSPAVAGRGTGTSVTRAASAGTALTLLTAAGASVALYLLVLRRLSGPAPLHTDETGGRGPAVVFVHGLGASGRYWDAVVSRLAGRRSVAVDLLGFGRSPKPRRASYDVGCHTDALAQGQRCGHRRRHTCPQRLRAGGRRWSRSRVPCAGRPGWWRQRGQRRGEGVRGGGSSRGSQGRGQQQSSSSSARQCSMPSRPAT